MDYSAVMSQAWQITWRHKWLWVLGFLAGLTLGGGGGGQVEYSTSDPNEITRWMEQWMASWETWLPLLLGFGVVMVVVGILLWLVVLAARGGLITAVDTLNQGGISSLGLAFRQGWRRVGRLVGMNLLLYLPLVLLAGLVVGLVVAGFITMLISAVGESGLDPAADMETVIRSLEGLAGMALGLVAMLCVLLCTLFVLLIVLQFVQAYAFRGIMLHDYGIWASLRHGWDVFRRNWVDNLVLAFIFFVIHLVTAFVVGVILAGLAFLTFGSDFWRVVLEGQFDAVNLPALIAAGLAAGIVAAALMAILVTWQSATFTLAYRIFIARMMPEKQPEPEPKLAL